MKGTDWAAHRRPHTVAASAANAEVERHRVQAHFLGVEAGQVEQVADHPLQPRGLGAEDRTDLRDALRRHDPVGERTRRSR